MKPLGMEIPEIDEREQLTTVRQQYHGRIFLSLFILSLAILFGYYLGQISGRNPSIQKQGNIVCNRDTIICPDGTTVGREEPSCEFLPCPTIDATERIVAADMSETCKIEVMTSKNNYTIETSLRTVNPQRRCLMYNEETASLQTDKNVYFPAYTKYNSFIAFEDISGGVDTQVRMVAFKDQILTTDNIEVLGTSKIYQMVFLDTGKLLVLTGFEGEKTNQSLIVYDVPGLYEQYPNNKAKDVDLFTNLQTYKKTIHLPNTDIVSGLAVIDGTVIISGKSGEVLATYSEGVL